MIAPLILATLLTAAPSGATDGSCAAGSYTTASLLNDLSTAVQQLVPFRNPWGRGGCTGACAARLSVKQETERHQQLVQRRGVGSWYGDGSAYHRMSDEEKQAWILEHTKPGQRPPSVDELSRSSCIEWVMEHIEAYYESTGDLETWERIEATVRSEKLTGTSLARELEAAGWTSIYMNADGDYEGATEPDGEHLYSRVVAQRDGTYYDVPVERSIVGWGSNPAALAEIEASPFFVYVARGGLHVTAGVDGQINELARGQGPDATVIYQDPLRDIIDIYTNEVHDGGDEGRQGAMSMWGSGLVMLPPPADGGRRPKL